MAKKINWKSILGWVIAIAVIFGIIGYNAHQEHLKSQTDKKRVYAILPITGGFAFQGKEEQKTMQVWMQNHPNAPFELEILDNESNPTKSLTLAQRAAMNDKSPLFIVPIGALGHPIAPQLESMNGFMILSPSTQEEDGTYKRVQRIMNSGPKVICIFGVNNYNPENSIYSIKLDNNNALPLSSFNTTHSMTSYLNQYTFDVSNPFALMSVYLEANVN